MLPTGKAHQLMRRLSNFVAAISLVLCIGTAVLWALSYSHDIGGEIGSRNAGRIGTRIDAGLLMLQIQHAPDPWAPKHGVDCWCDARSKNYVFNNAKAFRSVSWSLGWGDFRYKSDPNPAKSHLGPFSGFLMPLWSVVIFFATMPALSGASLWRRGKRKKGGLCPRCGYDLRATPGRCPECGSVPIQRIKDSN